MKVDMDTHLAPNLVVEARIKGSQSPDEWILVGNHRDAWEFGGVDPSSGTASLMEMTRAIGELKKQGLCPKRTLIACSWDGEEIGLTGSTEWGEQFADDLRKKLVAYLNVDSSVSGPDFQPSAVASLAPLIVEISRAVRHPSGKTLYEVWKEREQKSYRAAHKKGTVPDSSLVDTRIGSGSDHTVFLNFLSRPTLGLTFVGPYGVYHSIYDDFYWMNHFGDPGYGLHILLSQVWGLLALRLANAEILPFDFAFYAENIHQFVEEVKNQSGAGRKLDWRPLERRVAEFRNSALQFRRASDRALAEGTVDMAAGESINRCLMAVEGNWLDPNGIPGRPWFKHLLYAARFSYAHLELPGLTEAIEKGDWKVAAEQARLLENAISRNARLLSNVAEDLKKPGGHGPKVNPSRRDH